MRTIKHVFENWMYMSLCKCLKFFMLSDLIINKLKVYVYVYVIQLMGWCKVSVIFSFHENWFIGNFDFNLDKMLNELQEENNITFMSTIHIFFWIIS